MRDISGSQWTTCRDCFGHSEARAFVLQIHANILLITERPRNPHGFDERWKGCMRLIFVTDGTSD
jgi:hypothetical protein